jgi:hypothetical protein
MDSHLSVCTTKNKTLHTLLATAVAAVTESATRAVGRCNGMARICPAELLFYFYYYLLLFIIIYFILFYFIILCFLGHRQNLDV